MIHNTVLGIDVSKDKLDCCLVDACAERRIWSVQVPNTCAGIARLFAKANPDIPLVAEPTGRYSHLLAQQCQAAGHRLYLAPSRKAKKFCQSMQDRAKTDLLDSFGLAMFGASRHLAPYPLKSEAVEHLDSLLSYRKVLSGSISRMKLQAQSLPLAADRIRADAEQIEQLLKQLDKDIAAAVRSAPQFEAAARLKAVPGFGPVSSAALTSRLIHKNFTHPDQFVAYTGMDISVVQSGKRAGQLGMTKQGDAELRRILYCCAQASLRCKKDTVFKEQYAREKAKGHTHKQAVCAVARKMAKVAWSIVHHGTEYSRDRVFQQPRPPAAEPPELPGPADTALPA